MVGGVSMFGSVFGLVVEFVYVGIFLGCYISLCVRFVCVISVQEFFVFGCFYFCCCGVSGLCYGLWVVGEL